MIMSSRKRIEEIQKMCTFLQSLYCGSKSQPTTIYPDQSREEGEEKEEIISLVLLVRQ